MATQFALGHTVITLSASGKLDQSDVMTALSRHSLGDWGELQAEDRQANEEALKFGLRLLSAYRDRNRTRFWIITEADRSVTTVLLPEDY